MRLPDLVEVLSFAVNEQCHHSRLSVLRSSRSRRREKALLHIEHSTDPAEYCPITTSLGYSSFKKNLDLGGWRGAC